MRIAVFVTCLAEAFAPEVADAAAELVANTAADVQVVLVGDACCGQPAWNAGYAAEARSLARRLIPRLLAYDAVVVPSGSCAAMLLRYYPHLFAAGDPLAAQAESLAAKTHELSAYLAARLTDADAAEGDAIGPGARPTLASQVPIAFHPSCHSLRGAFVGDAGQRCLAAAGCQLRQQADAEECCGFGGMFAVKEEALSTAMADRKLEALISASVETVVSGELGCLLHLEGRARRRGMLLRFRHLAQVLAERGHEASD
ncbi:MAG TPA: (Fe-S)-binding protein [Bacillota bacterium]|nr:(Fe-S)-binding protein [Bacillota bacterium]